MRRAGLIFVVLVIALLGLTALLAGCGDDEGDEVTTSAVETETTAAETTDTSDEGTATTAGGTDTTGGEADGEQIFASTCAVCHGPEGEGGQGPSLQTRSDLTKDRVVDQVTNGGTSMPPYSPQLSETEIDAVADYVLEDIVQ